MNTAKKKDQIGRTEKAHYETEKAVGLHIEDIARIHPDVDPSEDITKSVVKVSANPMLVSDAQLKVLITALKAEQVRRLEASRASAPKVGSTVKVTGGPKLLIGSMGQVVEVRKSRVAVRLSGRADVALTFADVEVQP